jgi:hypothetical protein
LSPRNGLKLQIAIQVFYSRIRDDARRIVVNIAKLPKLLLPNVTSASSDVRYWSKADIV